MPAFLFSCEFRFRCFSLLSAACTCIFLQSCSSARVFQTLGNSERILSVADVIVKVRPGAMDADAAADYRSTSVSGSLRTALLMELQKRGKTASNGVVVDFEVTDFRLRSGPAVFWIGVMAGSDRIAGIVTARKCDQILKTFDASAKGNESAWSGMVLGRISAGSSADVFCSKIAKDIASQL